MQAEQQKKTGVSIASWMGTQCLLFIPLVNIITLVVLAIRSTNRTRRNFCIAALIWTGILLLTFAIAVVFFGPQLVEWCKSINSTLAGI